MRPIKDSSSSLGAIVAIFQWLHGPTAGFRGDLVSRRTGSIVATQGKSLNSCETVVEMWWGKSKSVIVFVT